MLYGKFFSYLVVLVLIISQPVFSEEIFIDTFDDGAVADASPLGGDNLWSELSSPSSYISEDTSLDMLKFFVDGNENYPYAQINTGLLSKLDFFDKPVSLVFDDIQKWTEAGGTPYRGRLWIQICSQNQFNATDRIEVAVWGNGKVYYKVYQNGNLVTGGYYVCGQSEQRYLSLTVDEDELHLVTYGDGLGNRKEVLVSHNLSSENWDASSGAYFFVRAMNHNDNDYYHKWKIGEIRVYEGNLWEEMIPSHGRYSVAYEFLNWQTENGKLLADKQENEYTFTTIDETRYIYQNEKYIKLTGLHLSPTWNAHSEPDYSGTSLIQISNCDYVYLEDIVIKLTDEKTRDLIRITNCREVYVKNVWISGQAINHIRIQGAKYVMVDGVEIEGRGYNNVIKCGNGIKIENGLDSADYNYDLSFSVIQNSYIHDCDSYDGNSERDGIVLQSCAQGILFNCYIENWKLGEGTEQAIDLSHRRNDSDYDNSYVYRVEKCLVKNCTQNKMSGSQAHASNKVIFANCEFINSYFAFAQADYEVFLVNNTFIYDDFFTQLAKQWGQTGDVYLTNNFIYSSSAMNRIFYSSLTGDKRQYINSDYNLYYMSDTVSDWYYDLYNIYSIENFGDWQNLGKDVNGLKFNSGITFSDVVNYDLTLPTGSVAKNAGGASYVDHSNQALRVVHDMNKNTRSATSPSAGAHE
jgi:hypothetical protein